MPMDIRNFFAKKGSSNSAKSKSSASADDKKKKSSVKSRSGSSSTSSNVRRSKTAPLSPIDEEHPKVAKRQYHLNSDSEEEEEEQKVELPKKKVSKLKKRQYHLNSDSESEEENEEEPKKRSATKNRKQQDISDGSDTEDEAEDENALAVSNTKKKKNEPKKEVSKKKEVSASDFFASSSSASNNKGGVRSSARKSNKPKRSYVLDDSSDEQEEEEAEKRPVKKHQKDSDEYIMMDDDDGDDDYEEEMKKPRTSSSRKRSSPTKASKTPPSKPVRKASPFKKQKIDEDDVVDITNDDDDDYEIDRQQKASPASSRAKNKRNSSVNNNKSKATEEEVEPRSTPVKKRKTQTTTSTSSAKWSPPKAPAAAKKEPLIEPTLELDSFNVDEAVSECMAGTTFVFSGILDGLSRDDGMDLVKILGGRVTTAVSSKTSYLVVGEFLEDNRPYVEGSKYKKAVSLGTVKIVKGEKKLYGLAKLYSDRAKAKQPALDKENNQDPKALLVASSSAAVAGAAPATNNPYAKKVVANPYAKKGAVVNPYAKKVAVNNPYAKKKSANNPYAKKSNNSQVGGGGDDDVHVDKKKFSPNDLWVDKYAPESTRSILGNKEAVTKLTTWLANWERKFNNDKAVGKAFSNPNGPWKAALLSGPPGIGKTTTATLVAKEAGRDTLEFNASDVRSKKVMSECFGDITGSQSVKGFFQKVGDGNKKKPSKSGPPQKKLRCLIFDEVDGMSAGDRGGMAELIQMIKNSRVPIICICNDRQSQKMKSLLPYCMDLRFRRPVKGQIAKAAIKVAEQEGLRVELNAAEAMAESCGNDIRQVINALQMWASEKECSTMTYKGLKEREKAINKDEILRVSLFDASKLILEGRRGLGDADVETQRANFFKRNDAFFTDYSFTGLIVQQNYLKLMNNRCNELKRKKDDDMVLDFLDDVHKAAETMSDYAMVEHKIRGGSDMNWSLLPFSGTLVVKNGFHASGPNGSYFPGFPEFTTWLGRNSSKGKKQRVLQELNHHMNYKISGGTQEVRLSYLPYLRGRFYNQLKESQGVDRNVEAIELMDDYGLDRDDVFENLDEFNLTSKASKLGDLLDSKEKAAFTRAFNASAHKSQALVSEQGAPKKTKRKGVGSSADLEDPDAINDDNFEEEEDEEDEEADLKKIQEAFAKNKGRGKGKATGTKTASKAKGKGRGKKK